MELGDRGGSGGGNFEGWLWGVGLIAVSIMVELFGKPSVGVLLPMLILADLTVYPLFRRCSRVWFDRVAHSREAGLAAGFVAGTATMVANSAGPVFQIFLLSRRFEKMELIGIGARFFLLINILKAPFLSGLDFINGESLLFNAKLVPVILLGVLVGRRLVQVVSQRLFEWLVVIFAVLAGGRLVFF